MASATPPRRSCGRPSGAELYALLGNGDVGRLSEILSADRAERLVLAWKEHLATGDVVVWLDEHGFERRFAKKIIGLWGAEAAAKLREPPYVMMALADWPVVDAAGGGSASLRTIPSASSPRRRLCSIRGWISITPRSASAISAPPSAGC